MLESSDEEDEAPHIAPRRPFNPMAPKRSDTLHCYGVDFLSNKDVLEALQGFEPREVEWLDDSSCNVVFDSPEAAQKALEGLAVPGAGADSSELPWRRTRKLHISSRRGKQAELPTAKGLRLQIREATEADRKDPTHSGRTDSVYYCHVKEQQDLKKQRGEAWQRKKRHRRQNRGGGAGSVGEQAPPPPSGPEGGGCAGAEALCAGAASAAVAPGGAQLRLGCRGPLDPLLFLRAPAAAASTAVADDAPGKGEDLRTVLERAEEEYAVVGAPLTKATDAGGRGQRREPRHRARHEDAVGSGGPGGPGHERGQKRRPTSQEPSQVAKEAPPPRRLQALPEIEAFLKEKRLRAKRYWVKPTFRSIIFGQQKKAKQPRSDAKVDEPPPWEQYLRSNRFTQNGQLMHTVAWDASGRRVLVVVPHPMRVDGEKLARVVGIPATEIRQRKLKDIQKETGFPTFVCPPFGHPRDAEGREPLLLVDASIREIRKPLLFDCGTVALGIRGDDLLWSTKASCIEGLAKPPAPTVPQATNPFAAASAVPLQREGDAVGNAAAAVVLAAPVAGSAAVPDVLMAQDAAKAAPVAPVAVSAAADATAVTLDAPMAEDAPEAELAAPALEGSPVGSPRFCEAAGTGEPAERPREVLASAPGEAPAPAVFPVPADASATRVTKRRAPRLPGAHAA